jgi:hypothetical protein
VTWGITVLIVGLAAIAGLCFTSFLLATGGLCLGLWLWRYLQRSRRITVDRKRTVEEWRSRVEEQRFRLPDAYAPKTVTRQVPNPDRIVSFGRVHLSFEGVEVGSGAVLVDGYGLFEPAKLEVPVFDAADTVSKIVEQLEGAIAELPIILSNERDDLPVQLETAFDTGAPLRGEELQLHELLGRLAAAYQSASTRSCRLNLVPPTHPLVGCLTRHFHRRSTPSTAGDEVLRLADQLNDSEAEITRGSADQVLSVWRQRMALISGVRFQSLCQDMAPLIMELGTVSHYSSFNFYCPHCCGETTEDLCTRDYSVTSEQDTSPVYYSEDSRCFFDSERGCWVCRTCERAVKQPIPIHKLLDDVLFPAYDRLIEENKLTRMRLDGQSRDDTLAYRNRLGQETEELMRRFETMQDESGTTVEHLRAEIDGDQQAIEGIQEIIRDYGMQQSKVLARISEQCHEMQGAVEERVQLASQASDAFFSTNLATMETSLSGLAEAKRMEDMIRDSIQVGLLSRMAASSEATASNTASIAETSRQTAFNTVDIAQSSRQTASNTADIAETSRQTASNTADIAQSSRQTASNTADIAETSRQTASNTADIAQSSRQTAQGVGELGTRLETSNAIQAAMAEKQGVELHDYSFWRLGTHVQMMTASIANALTGGSSLDRAGAKLRSVE